jgi:thymidylate synthase (FAD)
MRVDVLAYTGVLPDVMREAYGYDMISPDEPNGADALAEASGRLCYKSFDRPNSATATNSGYLANILRQGHFSVLEHASATFLVRDVSRALLTELTRHRHLSFSVVSQRYVDYGDTRPVMPPAVGDDYAMINDISQAYVEAVACYEHLVRRLRARGFKNKAAREAARAVLPNAAPVDMVVTGNMRAWRDVLGKRWHVAADAEIRDFAGLVLDHLRELAPNSFQDVPTEPYGG